MKIVRLFTITIVAASCNNKVYKLSEKDYKWMPYSGSETLIFNSNADHVDTLFFLKKDTIIAYPEAQSMHGVKYEVVSVFCRHSDAGTTNGNFRYLEGPFLEIKKSKDNKAVLNILLATKDATFYDVSVLKIDSLDLQSPLVFNTRFNQYEDVYIFNSDKNSPYSDRPEYVTKIYWSKSKGLIRYEKSNSMFWELKNSW